MKIPELYTYEIQAIIALLSSYVDDVAKEAKKIHRTTMIKNFLWPFGVKQRYLIAAVKIEMLTNQIVHSRELRDKLLEAHGIDDDGKPITFRQIISQPKAQ